MLICDRCGQTHEVRKFNVDLRGFNLYPDQVSVSSSDIRLDLCKKCRTQLWTLIKDFCAPPPVDGVDLKPCRSWRG